MKSPPVPVDETTVADNLAPGEIFPKLPLQHIDNGGEAFFAKKSYMVAMREGTLYDSVLKLQPAADKSSANICGYEILVRGVPFTIDGQGKFYIVSRPTQKHIEISTNIIEISMVLDMPTWWLGGFTSLSVYFP